MTKLKSYVELNIEALNRRKARAYTIWLLARALDPQGSGWVLSHHLRQAACKYMNCHRQTVWRALRQRTDFWLPCPDPKWIRYQSVGKLAETWGLILYRHPVYIDPTDFSTLQQLRATLLHTLFAGKPRTISHAKLGDLAHRTRGSVTRYLDSDKIEKHGNVMVCTAKPSPPDDPIDATLAKQGYFRSKINGLHRLLKRLPNTYFYPQAKTAPFGQIKNMQEGSSIPQGSFSRVFFTKSAAQRQAVESLLEGERIFCQQDGKTDAYGRRLWQGWSCTFGATQAC